MKNGIPRLTLKTARELVRREMAFRPLPFGGWTYVRPKRAFTK